MPVQRSAIHEEEFARLPGGVMVLAGLKALRAGEIDENGLLVLIAAPRLRRLGMDVPTRDDVPQPVEHELYALLETKLGDGAYSRNNAMLRTMSSFCHALESVSRRTFA